MKQLLSLSIIALLILAMSCKKTPDNGLIPITTSSEKALQFYNEAYASLAAANVTKFKEQIEQAFKEDPDFFMADYLMLIYNVNFVGDYESAGKYADAALNVKASLSEGEKLLQEIIRKQSADMKADISVEAQKIIEKYPKDFSGYYELSAYQLMTGNKDAQIETLKLATQNCQEQALAYNHLGYAYLNSNKLDEAGQAFNKYMELAPNQPNPYDSKGDYYMAIKDYATAYESYMKAHSIDTTWSMKKAEQAKMMVDSLNTGTTQLVTSH